MILKFQLLTLTLPSTQSLPIKSISSVRFLLKFTKSMKRSLMKLTLENNSHLCLKTSHYGTEILLMALLYSGLQTLLIKDVVILVGPMISLWYLLGGERDVQQDIPLKQEWAIKRCLRLGSRTNFIRKSLKLRKREVCSKHLPVLNSSNSPN
jgi:hypothetical protein